MANVTIDDADPSVVYFPSSAWNARSAAVPCSTCTANPNADLMFDDTFHDGTFNPVPGSNDFPNVPLTASVLFNGTAVYVFCALAESSTSPDGDSDMSFYIDGVLRGSFAKTAPNISNAYQYAIPVFAIESLTPEEHNMTLQNGHVNGIKSLVLLDEIVYTAINTTASSSSSSSPSSSSPTSAASSSTPSSSQGSVLTPPTSVSTSHSNHLGPIIGSIGAVVVLLLALALGYYFKRRKRQPTNARRATIDPIPPPENNMTGVLASEPLTLPSSHPRYGVVPVSVQQNAESGPSHFYSPSSYTPSSYASQSFNASAGPSGSYNNNQPDSVQGVLPIGHDGSSRRTGPGTSVSSASAGTSGIQPSNAGSGAISHPATESSASSGPAVDPFEDDIPDEDPPAYDELRARGASMRARDRKTRIQEVQRPSVVMNS